MIVGELKKMLENFADNDRVEIVSRLKSVKNEYSIEYSPIDSVRQVMIGCDVYVCGIIMPNVSG